MQKKLSIIIPVFQESSILVQTIYSLLGLDIACPFEIIISDGEPEHSSLDRIRTDQTLAKLTNICLVESEQGRGTQMNKGALKAGGRILLFLHADTRLDQTAMDLMLESCQNNASNYFCGAFDLAIDSPEKIFRIIEKTASARSRLTKIPYGDQAIFISRPLFDKIKGFPDFPIMEDVGLMQRIKNSSIKSIFLPHAITTSARKWKQQGILHTCFKNWVLICLYFLGISPKILAKYY